MRRKWMVTAVTGALMLFGCRDAGTAPERAEAPAPPNMASFFDLLDGVGDATVRSDALATPDNRQGLAAAVEGLVCFDLDPTVIDCPNPGASYHFNRPLRDWLGGVNVVRGAVAHVGRGCPAGSFPFGVPGGDPYLADPAGKIALIARGGCLFALKIKRAYEAGAIGVIVYNVPGVPVQILFQMGAAPELLGILSIPIPAVFVSNSTGLALAAGGGVVKMQGASFRVLREAVQSLIDGGVLTRRQASPLKDALSSASNAADAGRFAAAISHMAAFESAVLALASDGVLPDAEAAALHAAGERIVNNLRSAPGLGS